MRTCLRETDERVWSREFGVVSLDSRDTRREPRATSKPNALHDLEQPHVEGKEQDVEHGLVPEARAVHAKELSCASRGVSFESRYGLASLSTPYSTYDWNVNQVCHKLSQRRVRLATLH